jgi:outer membrane protein assembly factor BamB
MKIHSALFRLLVAVLVAYFANSIELATGAEVASVSDSSGRLLWRAKSTPCPLTRPIVRGRMLFLGTCDGKFYALDKQSGKVVWSYDARADGAAGSFETFPLVSHGLVIAGTTGSCSEKDSGYIYAFDPRDGAIRWKLHADAGSDNFASLDEMDPKGSIIFGTRAGERISAEAISGKLNWRFRAIPSGADCRRTTSLVTDGANVCFVAQDKTVYCLDGKTGQVLWKRKPDSQPTADVLMYKDVLYFGSADKHIYGLNPENGTTLVQLQTPYTPTGAIAETGAGEGEYEFAYGTNGEAGKGAVMSFSDEFDSVLWVRSSAEHWSSDKPEPWGKLVIAGNCRGDVVAYRVRDGEPQWHVHVGGCVHSLAHDDSTLYIAVREGAIYVYHPPGGKRP